MMNRGMALMLAALVGTSLPTAARADKLDARLNEEAPRIVQKLLDKKYSNVGVLRFRVEMPGKTASYTTPLSGNLVTRVQTGLILHVDRDGKPAMGVIQDVGTVATKQNVNSWRRSLIQRKKLFDLEYPLAWGKTEVKPDVFLTGTVKLSKDLKTTEVTIESFDKSKPGDQVTVANFSVPTDRNTLRDLGISFALPSAVRSRAIKLKKKDTEVDADAIETVGQTQDQQKDKDGAKDKDGSKEDITPKDDAGKDKDGTTQKDKDGATDKDKSKEKVKQDTGSKPDDVGGVTVRLIADGKPSIIRPAATQGDSIKWQVESPAPGQKIAFELTNNTDKTLGVVLRLNGKNIINEQTREPEICGKFVLKPKGQKFSTQVIRGFVYVEEGDGPGERGVKRRDGLDDDGPTPDSPPKDGKKDGAPKDGGKSGMKIGAFTILVGDDAAKAKADLGDKAGLIDVDVFETGSTDPTTEVNQRGLPPSKAKVARQTYRGLKTALLQSSGLKTKLEPRTGGVKARELIVPKPPEDREDVKAGLTSFAKPSLVSRITIKVVPRESAPE